MNERPHPVIPVRQETKKALLTYMVVALAERIEKHGDGTYASNHDGLGTIVEEYDEFLEAIRSNDDGEILKETTDLAVGALWMVATLIEKKKIVICPACGQARKSEDECGCAKSPTKAKE